MSERIAIVGTGQLGRLLSAGLAARGCEILPVQRATPAPLRLERLARAERALVAVGEDDLSSVLAALPAPLKHGRTWLLQNELLPEVWRGAGLLDPTVLVVWSEKKRGKPVSVVQTTLVAGPDRTLAVKALGEVDVPARAIEDGELEGALIDKNLYILVSNLAGLKVGGTVGELAEQHVELMRAVASEVLAVEAARVGRALDLEVFWPRLLTAFAADPGHGCRGRTAEARLERVLSHAQRLAVATPTLDSLRG